MAALMQCGCVSQGVDQDGKPVCVVHAGIHPGAHKEALEKPSLIGRKARCSYGNHGIVDSSYGLPFFVYEPKREMDTYYCGCFGWD